MSNLSPDQESVDFLLMVNVDMAYGEVRKLEAAFMRILSYARRLSGGNEDLAACITQMQKTIMYIKQIQMMIHAVQMAATAGPLGPLFAVLSIVGMGFMTADMMSDGMRVVS